MKVAKKIAVVRPLVEAMCMSGSVMPDMRTVVVSFDLLKAVAAAHNIKVDIDVATAHNIK